MVYEYKCTGCNGTGKDTLGRTCERCGGSGVLPVEELPPGSDPFRDKKTN